MSRSAAASNFEIGVRALGVGYAGAWTKDLPTAQRAFTAATQLDPDMADAWLGRAATGEVTKEVIWGAYSSSHNVGKARAGLAEPLPDGYLAAELVLPGDPLTSLRADSRETLALAEAIMDAVGARYQDPTITGPVPTDAIGDFDEAMLTLDSIDESLLSVLVRAALFTVSERWPDVLNTLRGHEFKAAGDPHLTSAAEVMRLRAMLHLGMANAVIDQVATMLKPENLHAYSPDHIPDMCWLQAHAMRNIGREEDARKLFEECVAHYGDQRRFAAAARNPDLRLAVVREEQLAARTNPWDASSTPDLAQVEAAANADRNKELLAQARAELDQMVGMSEVKSQLRRLQASIQMDRARAAQGIASTARTQHLTFTGPPGTGKTHVARLYALFLAGLGITARPEIVEVTPGDLKAGYQGQTEAKVKAVIHRALGGVLFIDEAYGLVSRSDGNVNFTKEAADTLLREMDEFREQLVVIIAGYEDEIEEFLDVNEGFRGRFARRIRFTTYTPDELVAIAEMMVAARHGKLTDDAKEALRDGCESLARKTVIADGKQRAAIDVLNNGRFIRNVIDKAEEERDIRVVESFGGDLDADADLDPDMTVTITVSDIGLALMSQQATLRKVG